MAETNMNGNILDRLLAIERRMDEIQKGRTLSGAVVSGGGMVVRGNGQFRVIDGDGRELAVFDPATDTVAIVGRLDTTLDEGGISIVPGDSPKIIIRAESESSHHSEIYATNLGGGEAGSFVTHIAAHNSSTGDFDGGFVQVSEVSARLGTSDADEVFGEFRTDMTGHWRWIGHFHNFVTPDTRQAVFTGIVAGGTTGVVVSYGATMATTMVPVCTPLGPVASWSVTAYSTSSFTCNWSGGASHDLGVWAYRVA